MPKGMGDTLPQSDRYAYANVRHRLALTLARGGAYPMKLLRMQLLIVIGALVNAIGMSAVAANTPIYQCADARGGLLYPDTPCKGGERLNLKPGVADPDAVMRLERAQAALDAAAAKRS